MFTRESLAEQPIRQPTIEEAPLLRELEHAVFPEPYTSPVKSWRFEIERTPMRTDVITIGDRPVGLCYVRMIFPDVFNRLARPYGEVGLLVVAQDFQRMGVGERLLKAGIAKLSENDAASVVLQTATDNHPMQRLAKKAGFADDGKLIDYYGPRQDALQYRFSPRRVLKG